jgi:Transposase DNA-binding/Transposase Tn5 dimerisation domain
VTLSNLVWASQVAIAAELPDQRLDKRLATVIVDTIERPDASIPQASGSAGQAKAAYRFYSNPRVTAEALHLGFTVDTAQRCLDQDVVLVVQDTTTLNLTNLRAIKELGPIDSGGLARGVHLHTSLAVTASGQVVGILDQQYWARPQPGQPKPPEKESDKWINGIDASRAVLYQTAGDRPAPRLIHLMDREGDAYEVMMAVVDAGDSAIIRCAQNRRIDDPLSKAQEAVRSRPVLCCAAISVPRQGGVPERRALVQVRSSRVWLRPDLDKYPHAWPMTWSLVELWEPEPPAGAEPIHWLLWTLEPAASASEALEVVRKYTCRWPIEEFHLALKSGCHVEELRLKRWERQKKAVIVDSAVAARIVSLRDLARETPEAPALQVLTEDEVGALACHFGNGMKPSELTIGRAVLWIGRLGGHLNRKRDGMPGVRTLWRGLHDLTLLAAGFRAARKLRE